MDILLAIRAIRVRMPHCELKWEIPIKVRALLKRERTNP